LVTRPYLVTGLLSDDNLFAAMPSNCRHSLQGFAPDHFSKAQCPSTIRRPTLGEWERAGTTGSGALTWKLRRMATLLHPGYGLIDPNAPSLKICETTMICVFFAAASISLASAGSRSGCRLVSGSFSTIGSGGARGNQRNLQIFDIAEETNTEDDYQTEAEGPAPCVKGAYPGAGYAASG
jgi:hypothetical protein